MKVKTIYQALFVFLVYSCGVYGQSNYLLDYFKAYRTGDKILLIWQMGKGNQCSGLAIHRSTNDESFEKIGEILGVCGSDTTAQFYSFTDEAPIPGKTHRYMLELGLYGKTDPPVEVFYPDFSTSLSQVIPNPISETGRIVYYNPRDEEHRLLVYDSSGRLLESQSTREAYFLINANDYHQATSSSSVDGIQIYYQIHNTSDNSEVSSGKIAMLKTKK